MSLNALKRLIKGLPPFAGLIAQRDAVAAEHTRLTRRFELLEAEYAQFRIEHGHQENVEASRQRWKEGLDDETHFWREVIAGRPPEYHADMIARCDPSKPLLPELQALLPQRPIDQLTVLDVAAGPVSICGWRIDGKRVCLIPVDALADRYNELLDHAAFVPPFRTIKCDGEDLLETFGRKRFDLVYIRNALDHTPNPLTVTQQMLAVARPGAAIYITGYLNEGEAGVYTGLHQWNIDVRDGRLVYWNKEQTIWVDEAIANVDIEVSTSPPERQMVAILRSKG